MKTEKEIRDRLNTLLIERNEVKKEFDKEPYDSKYAMDIFADLLEIESAIAYLKWVLGE